MTKKSKSKKNDEITGFKGFNPDWTCRDFRYEVGKEYETGRAELCDCGFHFCEHPLDILNYYPVFNHKKGTLNKFATVSASGVTDEKSEDSKRAATHLKVTGEIALPGLVKAAFDFVWNKATKEKDASTGYGAHNASTGNEAHNASTGDRAHNASTGNGAHSIAAGDKSSCRVSGKESIAAAVGIKSKAAGALGCWLVLTEWEQVGGKWHIKSVETACVDGEKIKPDVYYVLRNGEFMEAE